MSPQLTDPPPFVRNWLRVPLAAVAVGLIAYLLGLDLGPLNGFMARWAPVVLEIGGAAACAARAVLVRRERAAWALLAIAAGLWALGGALWAATYYSWAEPPVPSIADALWIAFYPFAYAGIALLIRQRARHVSAAIWVDGLIAALAVGAVATAVVYNAVLGEIGGTELSTAVNLAYVLADALMVGLVLVAFALGGWRLDRTWAWLGGALALFAVSDSIYLYEVAQGTYASGGLLDAGWGIALLLVGVAAWHTGEPRRTAPRIESWRSIALPIAFGIVALAIEVYDHFTQVTVLSLILATACLAAVLGRLAMTFGQNLRMLRATRQEATTDALTGLGNRRRLMADLDRVLRDGQRHVLLLLDIDRFKAYNDTYGHPAADALLIRVANRLESSLRPWGRAYRLGGDEFCALLKTQGEAPEMLASLAAGAFTERNNRFQVSSSVGWALLPGEVDGPSGALRLADRRMYAHKEDPRRKDRRGGNRASLTDRRTHTTRAPSSVTAAPGDGEGWLEPAATRRRSR